MYGRPVKTDTSDVTDFSKAMEKKL